MNQEEKEHFEEFLLKAVQAGKSETSGLVDTIMHKMEKGIEESINKNVNGKIKKLDEKLDDYIKSDNEWKDKYSPYLDGLKSITISGKIVLWIAVFLSSIIGVVKLLK